MSISWEFYETTVGSARGVILLQSQLWEGNSEIY